MIPAGGMSSLTTNMPHTPAVPLQCAFRLCDTKVLPEPMSPRSTCSIQLLIIYAVPGAVLHVVCISFRILDSLSGSASVGFDSLQPDDFCPDPSMDLSSSCTSFFKKIRFDCCSRLPVRQSVHMPPQLTLPAPAARSHATFTPLSNSRVSCTTFPLSSVTFW
jgi:hypothetical protein